ncbi:ribose 5-phosphate isomerase B [Alkalibacter rhizosphaerae]|uniref:Ribose 5-phosphate isomerase B n=1 Tax=Alkalibacter rhizosphaerae TaxID=2815577 RepID=A0A975AH13_9FIRM|nr:ribose 5-phosphate isomerase B [Alkalibacter rhizosphaerae]QSX08134.1 ribose 5-phosphate isomerase B [Alkalibacter rhizosphaerae]
MKIAIGCDEAGVRLRDALKAFAEEKGHELTDFGVKEGESVLYPMIAEKIAASVAAGTHERGIIICGTGIGMAITANKVPGIRATVAHDVYSAERSIKSNNCQIITMGERVIGVENAKTVLSAWLESEFAGGSSQPKVDKMVEIDQQYRSQR